MKKKFTDKQMMILDVAEELIAKKGFDGTSVRDICSKAGINVAMISYYFGSKEKMMTYLYQYRVRKSRENFAQFADTIKNGKPEMQMREIVKFIINQMFKYSYFHGFVKQEIRHTDYINDDLLGFYNMSVEKIDEVIKMGVASGVFTTAPKAEDILTTIIGSPIFVIRNKSFFEDYLPVKVPSSEETYLIEAEKKVYNNVLLMIFSYLGYVVD